MSMRTDEKRAELRRRALADIAATSDEEDARITAAALSDPDAQPWTDEMWANAVPYEEYRRQRQAAGASPDGVQYVGLHIDKAVLDHFVKSGLGWRERINEALRQAAGMEPPAKQESIQRRPADTAGARVSE